MHRTRVAVIRGGPSDEYDVSLKTGAGVMSALGETNQYQVSDIVITRSGDWIIDGRVKAPHQALAAIDVVFNALHGTYGEDGQLQRLLDQHCIKYTGSGAYASAVAMNKALTKDHLKESGILLAPHMQISREGSANVHRTALSVGELFGPKYVVKPLTGGSSFGTRIVSGTAELAKALEVVFQTYDQVIVEQYVEGKEATIGVIEGYRGERLYRLPAIEIVPPPDAEFFDTEVKYNGKTEELCPGRFTRDEKEEIARIGSTVHELLGLRHYSRTDVIVAKDGIYFLEVNTLPGLTPTSLMPVAISAVGGTYGEFVHHLLDQALA